MVFIVSRAAFTARSSCVAVVVVDSSGMILVGMGGCGVTDFGNVNGGGDDGGGGGGISELVPSSCAISIMSKSRV